jgi:class 3 adenylate cyclase
VQTVRREAAILQAELRNFTRMSEMLDPEKVLALASDFFSLAGEIVREQSGKVLSVYNDTLLAAFPGGTPAEFSGYALSAAQHLQRDFGSLGERWQTEYGLPAAVSVGIHLGETVFGMAGPAGAQQFVAFGDPVSIAERLVHRARNGEIVLSLPVMKALGPAADGLGAQPLPPIELSKRPSIPIYGILLEDRLDFT